MPIRFDNRVVIVTGAGQGLGRSHALGFAALGAHVVVNDMAPEAAERVAAEIRAAGGSAQAVAASVTDADAVARMVDGLMAEHGRIDVLVANAGILRDKSFAKMEAAEWEAVMAVHLDGTFHVARAVWPHMRAANYGRIVATTSSSGLFGNFGQANYGAAKMGLVGLVRTLAIEGEKYGIRANAVAPIAWTAMTAALFPPGTDTVFEPEKVTPGVLYLASEGAPNGTVLSAGGGVFAAVHIMESAGVKVSEGIPTADDVAAAWARIADTGSATALPNGPIQTLKFLQVAQA